MRISKPGSYTGTIIEHSVVDIVFFRAKSILGVFTAVMEKEYIKITSAFKDML